MRSRFLKLSRRNCLGTSKMHFNSCGIVRSQIKFQNTGEGGVRVEKGWGGGGERGFNWNIKSFGGQVPQSSNLYLCAPLLLYVNVIFKSYISL